MLPPLRPLTANTVHGSNATRPGSHSGVGFGVAA
jgi:hypothetical protein